MKSLFKNQTSSKTIEVFTDGGALSNPGPAALGVVIKYKNQIKTYSKDLGIKTNNQAEYLAAIFALKKIKELIGKKVAKNYDVIIYSDSQLLVYQMSNKWKIEDKELMFLFVELHNLTLDFKSVIFNYIEREKNYLADKLVKNMLLRRGAGVV